MNLTHTTLPWQKRETQTNTGLSIAIIGATSAVVCLIKTASGNKKENADFIVTACNIHYDLLEALKEAKDIIAYIRHRDAQWHNSETLNWSEKARAAIAKAEGQ